MTTSLIRPEVLAPCGVYCGACPSYRVSCKGCASADKNQKRSSKWSCKIRMCCYEKKQLNYCIECEEFICAIIDKKLFKPHRYDPQFTYRHEIPVIFTLLKTLSVTEYLAFQEERWRCDACGGTIMMYHYACRNCGHRQMIGKPIEK